MLTLLSRGRGLTALAFIALVMAVSTPAAAGGGSKAIAQYKTLLQESLTQKFGVIFYLHGQTVAGVVTKITDENVVEVRNQEHDRVIIRLDAIDAIAH